MNGQKIPELSASSKAGMAWGFVARTIVSRNTFDNPTAVSLEMLTSVQMGDGGFSAILPAQSVIVSELK